MTVTGVDSLKSKLAKMPALVEMRAKAAMEKGADEIVAMMKRLVPVDDGDLRDSIGWTWGEAPKGSVKIAGSRKRGPNDLFLTIYAGNEKAYYARWVEFGTVKMARKAFFFPSYRALETRTRRRVLMASRKALKEVAAGGR